MLPVPFEKHGLMWACAVILLLTAGCTTAPPRPNARIVWQAPVRWGPLCEPITPETSEERLGYAFSVGDAEFLETTCRHIADDAPGTGGISDALGDFFLALPIDTWAPTYGIVWDRVAGIELDLTRQCFEGVTVSVSFTNLTLEAFCRQLTLAANEALAPVSGSPGIVIRSPCNFDATSQQRDRVNLISYTKDDVTVLDAVRDVSRQHGYVYEFDPYSVWIGYLHQPMGSEWENPVWSCVVAEARVPEALRRLLDAQPCHSAVVDRLEDFGLFPGARGLVAYDCDAGRLVWIGPSETSEIFLLLVDALARPDAPDLTGGSASGSGKER